MIRAVAIRTVTGPSIGNTCEPRWARRQRSTRARPDQLEELHPCPGVVPERTQHGARDGKRVLFFHATHRHAQVRAFAHDGHTEWIDLLTNGLGNLVGHPLLDLQATSEHVDQSRNLAETNDVALRDVRHVTLTKERQDMVLAEAVEIDVLHDDHLAVVDREERIVENAVDIGAVAAREELERFLNALWSPDQPLASRVLAQLDQQLLDEILHGFYFIVRSPPAPAPRAGCSPGRSCLRDTRIRKSAPRSCAAAPRRTTVWSTSRGR